MDEWQRVDAYVILVDGHVGCSNFTSDARRTKSDDGRRRDVCVLSDGSSESIITLLSIPKKNK